MRALRGGTAALTLLLAGAGAGLAQSALERNLPPAARSDGAAGLPAPAQGPASDDATPLGVDLKGMVFLSATDPVEAAPVAAVDTTRVPILADPAFVTEMAALLGRPVTRQMLSQIEARAAGRFRAAGRPFVSVTTPPQEVTGGVLRFRVVEYRAGDVRVDGADAGTAARARQSVRLERGGAVETARLQEDLDWLNRSPFRSVEAEFAPGSRFGETDLSLKVNQGTPWQVFGGYANSGSQTTGLDRWYVGGMLADLPLSGSLLSYQFTTSSDFWWDDGRAFAQAGDPAYVSHGARFLLPLAARQEMEATFSAVESSEAAEAFDVLKQTVEFSLGYRGALSNLIGTPAGDVSAGLETKRQSRDTFFGGTQVLAQAIEVRQLYLGWNGGGTDGFGRYSLDASVHVSPGDIGRDNSNADFALYSGGRVTDASYAYAEAVYSRTVDLPHAMKLNGTFIGQYAAQPLPETEQFTLGGEYAVRGYTSEDGSFDAGLIFRGEWRLPSFAALPKTAGVNDALSPFLFVDAGFGYDQFIDVEVTAASVGLGADWQLGSALRANLALACALADAVATRSGDWSLLARVTASY
ncbi:MAG TPA: ShlB/FhaC/HecB family hemolysin secretion/activation protein [Xanthobacteraceae bacterium]|nr:ShlB/FhaC/HecB family hemolysin secretion/activation protein [Xanthobacteraceae bacterium]